MEMQSILSTSSDPGKNPFGGKLFLEIGDFRQVASVVRGSGLTGTFEVSIQSSHLWPHFKILRLDLPVQNTSDPNTQDG